MIPHQCEESEPLLSGYLDGELTQMDRQKVELILDDCPTCQKTYNDLEQLRQNVGGIPYQTMTATEKDELSKEATGAVSANIGQFLLLGGFIVLYGTGGFYLLREILTDGDAPWFVRVGVPALFLGFGILFITVLVQRMRAAKTDKYKNVRI